MSTITNNCIPSMSVGSAVDALSNMYSAIASKSSDLTMIPACFLWSAPGSGKSQCVKEIANELEYRTNKKVNLTDVRLLLFNPIDLRGIPTANEDKTLAVWLRPKLFDMDPSEDVINILFLDELSAAPPSVQAAAYQICLDHTVGEHKLPKNCIVIAAGNRVTDKSVAFNMPKALANRLMHFEIEVSFESWKKWAIGKGINRKVVGFLSFRPDYLMKFDSSTTDLAFPTPRSWEMVSNVLNTVNENISTVYPLIAGLIGTGAAIEFKSWDKVYNNLPKIEDIFKGKVNNTPKESSTLYALSSSIIAFAKEHSSDINGIDNLVQYIVTFPADFAFITMKDLMYIEKDYKKVLMKIPAFQRFVQTKGKIINDI